MHFSSRMLGARRLGKLATFVLYMAEDTDLVGASISNYVWAFRSWRIFPFSSPSLPLPLPLPLPLLYLRRVHWILEECTGLREGKNLSLTQGIRPTQHTCASPQEGIARTKPLTTSLGSPNCPLNSARRVD